MLLSDLAKKIGAEIFSKDNKNAANLEINNLAPIDRAKAGDVSFISNPEYLKFVSQTQASAIIVKDKIEDAPITQLIHKNPYLGFAKTAQLFYKPHFTAKGISEKAEVSSKAKLGSNVTIYPFVVIDDHVEISDNTVILPGSYIGEGSTIGSDCIIYSNVSIYHGCKVGKNCIIHSGTIIGGDGFGFAPDENEIVKIPQVGNVILGDYVEIGASCTIDRGAMGPTMIKNHSKLDSNVHVAHNVEVGECCMFAAFTGIAGSTKIGNHVLMGGHAAVNGHIKIGDNITLGALAGATKSLNESGTYMGFPASPASAWRRQQIYIRKLSSYEERIKSLEQKLNELTEKS